MASISREESLAGQIKGLKEGQSASKSRRIDLRDPSRLTTAEALHKLRNLMNQAVGRIRKEAPGSNFRVESVVGVTDDKQALIVTVAATRLAANDTDEENDI